MAGARDIEGTGFSFAAGIAFGMSLIANSHPLPLSAGILIIFIASLAMLSLTLPANDRTLSSIVIPFEIFFLAGIFCALNSTFSLPLQEDDGGLPARTVAALRSMIDAIPYPSTTSGPMVKALLTGDKSGLTKDVMEIFRRSGASHILALSGLHLGIIYLIISKITLPLGNSPKAKVARSISIMAICGYYSIMTGATQSIVRAFIFIFLNETAKIMKRKASLPKVFFAALTIQLCIDPSAIASVSFQLSYSAILGIFMIFPCLRGIYPGGRGPLKWIWESAALSISCQAFTAPIAWHYFHTFPKYFLITNLIALPMTSAIMVLSVATIALSVLGICPCQLVSLNDMALQALSSCLGIISSM